MKIRTRDIEREAIQQLVDVSQPPIVPMGVGATVGSAIPTDRPSFPPPVTKRDNQGPSRPLRYCLFSINRSSATG